MNDSTIDDSIVEASNSDSIGNDEENKIDSGNDDSLDSTLSKIALSNKTDNNIPKEKEEIFEDNDISGADKN